MLSHCVCVCSQQVDRMVGKNRSDMFGELLQAANNTGDLRSCPVRRYFHQHDSARYTPPGRLIFASCISKTQEQVAP